MKWYLKIMVFALPQLAAAQEVFNLGEPLAKITLAQTDLVSVDTRDQIFISFENGDIYLFDESGKQINFFSPPRQARLQQLEASWTVNIFSFSADLQEYRILDRFLNPLVEKSLLNDEITLPKAATLGNNNVIWVWDESDLSLKSLNYLQNKILNSQPLNLVLDMENLSVLEIRELKNRVFMNIPDYGILVFDNQGNFFQKLEIRTKQRICFYRDRLLWIEGGMLKSMEISTKKQLNHGKILMDQAESIQFGQEILVVQSALGVQVYTLPKVLGELD